MSILERTLAELQEIPGERAESAIKFVASVISWSIGHDITPKQIAGVYNIRRGFNLDSHGKRSSSVETDRERDYKKICHYLIVANERGLMLYSLAQLKVRTQRYALTKPQKELLNNLVKTYGLDE